MGTSGNSHILIKMGAGKKKWSKGKSRDVVPSAVLMEQKAYDKGMAEVPKMKLITPSTLCEKLRINASLAKIVLKKLADDGAIKHVTTHKRQIIYTRNAKETVAGDE